MKLVLEGILALTTVFATTCAAAKPAPAKTPAAPAAPRDPCAGSANEAALLACRRLENRKSEEALRALADRLAKGYEDDEPARAKVFADARARWQEFRDAECKLRTYDSANGTAHEVYWLACLTAMNGERLEVLRKLADNP
jgi:uncharacterized protein YecT (DUF1311 family)